MPLTISGFTAAALMWGFGLGVGGAAAVRPVPSAVITSPKYPGVTCRVIAAPLRDGTLLNTYVYQPAAKGRYPVILQRNPYGRTTSDGCFEGSLDTNQTTFAQHGYVALTQDVRGTYLSEGVFHAMTQEAQDGYDAIEWAARQSWSNGKVGTTSGSYLGLTQWQPAIHNPPHLFAIAPQITGSDYHDNWTYVNGVFDLWLNQSWPSGSFVGDQITGAAVAAGLTPRRSRRRWQRRTRMSHAT